MPGSWYGLGPVSVQPEHRRKGIGKALIQEGLSRLKYLDARGCCLVGHPDYYRKFGFRNMPGLVHEGVPQEIFCALCLDDISRRVPSRSTKDSKQTAHDRMGEVKSCRVAAQTDLIGKEKNGEGPCAEEDSVDTYAPPRGWRSRAHRLREISPAGQ